MSIATLVAVVGGGGAVLLLAVPGRPAAVRPSGATVVRPLDHPATRRAAGGRSVPPGLVLAIFGAWLAVVFGVTVGVLGVGVAIGGRAVLRRDRERRRRAAIARAVPDLVDLFLIAASAGHPVAAALLAVCDRAPPALRPAATAAAHRFRRGLPLADCLHHLAGELGKSGEPLTDALAQSASSGVPLVPLLEGVAAIARDERRRRSEAAARRLPVTMLFPLAACILPAAVLLAVVPVLVVSVTSLSL